MIRIGPSIRPKYFPAATVDPDAQAFITAAGITDATQQSAINTLVTDLKGYGIWSKMKAIYPFVGGTSSTHKWNLKDPRDLDAAFRLTFLGGITHDSNGITGNGTNGYFNTHINPSLNLSLNNTSVWSYTRTQLARDSDCLLSTFDSINNAILLNPRNASNLFGSRLNSTNLGSIANSDSRGLFGLSRLSASNYGGFINTTKSTINESSTALQNGNILGFLFSLGSVYSLRNMSFASIGDGLTDTEAANFYTSVQKYQTTLGRHVGTPIVADSDAQAFLNAAEITSVTEANAVDKLVTDLKTYGIWTKMKAIYPFVGGTSSTHKWNLKDPRDLDAAFRLVFSGGITHSSTGAFFGGVNGFADTFLIPNISLSLNSTHISVYSRTNTSSLTPLISDQSGLGTSLLNIFPRYSASNDIYFRVNSLPTSSVGTNTSSAAFYLANRISSTETRNLRNNTQYVQSSSSGSLSVSSIYLSRQSTAYSDRECAFASIGDGLTDTEAANLYTAVQAYQTSLNRQV